MKQLILCLALLLMLTGCTKTAPPASEPESPPAEIILPEPSEPEPEPAPEPVPEAPAEAEPPALPNLPLPVYCWNDTAVANDGTVILQVPDHLLELCFDAVTGKPAGILSNPANVSWNTLYDGFYALDGTPILTDTGMPYFQCFGDLCWYGVTGDFVVQRLSDGVILHDGLRSVTPAGDYLVLQPAFWNDRCMLLDKTGQTVLELDRGFSLQAVCKDGGTSYLIMASTLDGAMNLINTAGQPLLTAFYEEILDVSQGYAIVRDGSTYLAIDLTTGETVFTWDNFFVLLPDGAIADTNQGSILVDRRGNRLDDRLLDTGSLIYDWNGDGNPEYILTTTMQDFYQTLVLAADGTQLAAIPMHTISVHALSPTTLAYATPTGTDALVFEAHLVDLQAGTDTVLTKGKNLYVEPITTSGGQMLLCTGDEGAQLFLNDGTPALPDLGYARYLGGDVFANEAGLKCLDGSWLYQAD